MAIVINGSGTVTGLAVGGLPDGTVDAGTLATNSVDSAELIDGAVDDSHMASISGRKNMIINGDMMIDQKNAGASATTTASVYTADRFQLYASTINNAQTYQQVAEAPAGFNKSLKITNSSTAQAAGSNALFTPRQRIEGYNIAHLNWGTSDAQTVTISFWVKASVTGTYPLAINNGNFDRSFVTSYTVSVANTWEKKTATIAGDTSGTWAVDNTTGMIIMFSLDTYADFQTSTVDSWTSTNDRATSSHVHFLATASATWQITGIQMETGSVATDFEQRSYGEELALCQRYYAVKRMDTSTGGGHFAMGQCNTSTRLDCVVYFPQTMRLQHGTSIIFDTATDYRVQSAGALYVCSAISGESSSPDSAILYATSSGMTAGRAGVLIVAANSPVDIKFDAEL
jgi:hypothetical protein